MTPVSPSTGPPGLSARFREGRPGFELMIDRGIEAAEVARALYRYAPSAPVVLAEAETAYDGRIAIRFAPRPPGLAPVSYCHFAGPAREIRTRLGAAPLPFAAALALADGMHITSVRGVEGYRTFSLAFPHVVRGWAPERPA